MLFCKIVIHICLDYIEVNGNLHYLYVYMCEHLGHESFPKTYFYFDLPNYIMD